MDEYLREIYVTLYRRWVLIQLEKMHFSQFEEKKDQIIFETEKVFCHIIFNDNEIIELSVINKAKGEPEFYLHFQMNQLSHAIHLFLEMMKCIHEIDNKPILRVLLCCSGGLTTSFFAYQLNALIQSKKLDIEVSAKEYGHIFEVAYMYDIILLAPQVSYKLAETKRYLKDKIVKTIPAKCYAKNDVESMLDLIIETLDNEHRQKDQKSLFNEHLGEINQYLCLSIFQSAFKNHIHYRIYDKQQQVSYENEIVKESVTVEDIYGVIDTMIANNHIHTIGISLPGIVKDGVVSSSFVVGENGAFKELLENKYQKKVCVINDVNAAAIGFHQKNNQYASFAYIFQPIGIFAGVGLCINHQLIDGKYGLAGEVKLLPSELSNQMEKLSVTPEGVKKLLSQIIVTISAIISPEAFVISCDLLDEVSELKEKVIENFSAHVPNYDLEIMKVDDMQDDILNGICTLCSYSNTKAN